MSAVGSADDRDTAGDRALSNLAKIFEVAVSDNSLDFASAKVITTGGQSATENEQKVSRSINTTVDQVIEGARVAEFWENEQGSRLCSGYSRSQCSGKSLPPGYPRSGSRSD